MSQMDADNEKVVYGYLSEFNDDIRDPLLSDEQLARQIALQHHPRTVELFLTNVDAYVAEVPFRGHMVGVISNIFFGNDADAKNWLASMIELTRQAFESRANTD